MLEINHIRQKFNNLPELNDQFNQGIPIPNIILDEFLPHETALKLEQECISIPEEYWSKFTRRDSYMEECINMEVAPEAFSVINQIHSQIGMDWLSKLTGIPGLLPDPHLTGAGYSRAYRGNTLKMHSDFNWNDRLRLHRAASMIIYLNSNWKESYNGELEFRDFENKETVTTIPTLFNRCLIWKYHKHGFHGFTKPLACPQMLSRNSLRLFFYVSNSEHDAEDPPHRSLYWFDPDTKKPYDIKS